MSNRLQKKQNSPEGLTHLMRLVLQNDDVGVDALLENEVVDLERVYKGQTPLMVAIGSGNFKIAKSLLEWGADPNFVSKSEETALSLAAKKGNAKFVKLLLNHDAEVDGRDREHNTALMVASRNGGLKFRNVVRALLKHGANPKLANKAGNTSLLTAVENGHIKMANLLLDAGADMHQENERGQSAYQLVREKKLPMHRIVADKNYSEDEILLQAVAKGHVAVIENMVEEGADINTLLKNGETALTFAAGRTIDAVTKTLLRLGADVHKVNKENKTALVKAAEIEDRKTVTLLIDNGADINADLNLLKSAHRIDEKTINFLEDVLKEIEEQRKIAEITLPPVQAKIPKKDEAIKTEKTSGEIKKQVRRERRGRNIANLRRYLRNCSGGRAAKVLRLNAIEILVKLGAEFPAREQSNLNCKATRRRFRGRSE